MADGLEVAVPHMAVMTRAEALGFARSGRMKFLPYETSDLHIRVYGDAAVVTRQLLRTRTLKTTLERSILTALSSSPRARLAPGSTGSAARFSAHSSAGKRLHCGLPLSNL